VLQEEEDAEKQIKPSPDAETTILFIRPSTVGMSALHSTLLNILIFQFLLFFHSLNSNIYCLMSRIASSI